MLLPSFLSDASLDFLIWNHLILRAAHPASASGIPLCAQMLLATVFTTSPPPFRLVIQPLVNSRAPRAQRPVLRG